LLPYSKVGGCRLFEVDVIRAFLKRWRCGRPSDDVLAEALAGANRAIEETEELLAAFAASNDDDPDPADDDDAAPEGTDDLAVFRREVLRLVCENGFPVPRAVDNVTAFGRFREVAGIEDVIRDITPRNGFYFLHKPGEEWVATEFMHGKAVGDKRETEEKTFEPVRYRWADVIPSGDDEAIEGTLATVVVKMARGSTADPSEFTVTRWVGPSENSD
jgi:hypothetical protein